MRISFVFSVSTKDSKQTCISPFCWKGSFPSKPTTLIDCYSPYWPAGCSSSWIILLLNYSSLQDIIWVKESGLNVRRAGCPSMLKTKSSKRLCGEVTLPADTACLLSLGQRHRCEQKELLCLKAEIQLAIRSTPPAAQTCQCTCIHAH